MSALKAEDPVGPTVSFSGTQNGSTPKKATTITMLPELRAQTQEHTAGCSCGPSFQEKLSRETLQRAFYPSFNTEA